MVKYVEGRILLICKVHAVDRSLKLGKVFVRLLYEPYKCPDHLGTFLLERELLVIKLLEALIRLKPIRQECAQCLRRIQRVLELSRRALDQSCHSLDLRRLIEILEHQVFILLEDLAGARHVRELEVQEFIPLAAYKIQFFQTVSDRAFLMSLHLSVDKIRYVYYRIKRYGIPRLGSLLRSKNIERLVILQILKHAVFGLYHPAVVRQERNNIARHSLELLADDKPSFRLESLARLIFGPDPVHVVREAS